MKKLGTIPIPELRYQKKGNRAQMARKMLEELVPGKADLYEFVDKKEAQDLRGMLSSMAILKFGEAGHISTSIVDNTMYLWLREPERKED
jgi:hypothetical protein